jgi:acetylglutamate kinase
MNNTKEVISTLSYVKKFAGETILIKLGGAALQDATIVQSLCQDLQAIRSVGLKVVLVHGGGPAINQELKARGIDWEFIDGQRVTTPAMMEVIEMVLCGLVNRRIVRALNAAGVRAIGMSGSDANLLLCQQASQKLGQVGKIDRVDAQVIHSVLNSDTIPVIAPVGMSVEGEAFNINADWAASRIAQALGINKMLFLTDQDGILNARGTLIQELDAAQLESLVETNVVYGGMLAKAQTILSALGNGVQDVHVLNARHPHGLIEELFTDGGVGTICRLRSRAAGAKHD